MGFAAKYRKEFPQKLIDFMTEGGSFEGFGAKVNTSRTALYKWLDKYPKFKEAYDCGVLKAQAYYENLKRAKTSGQVIKNFDSKLCDAGLLGFTLRTRFHKTYGIKDEVDHKSSDGSMKVIFVNPSQAEDEK